MYFCEGTTQFALGPLKVHMLNTLGSPQKCLPRALNIMEESLPNYNPNTKVHGAHLGPVGPRWAPCWPHEPCYQGIDP